MPDITAILAKPEDFGFTFLTETVKRMKRTSGTVPLIKVTDLMKFEASFPGVILETEDGQSIRVNSQRVVRDAWFADVPDKDLASLKMRLVKWLLKIETPVERTVTKYRVKIEGEWLEFASQEEADAAEAELQNA